MNYLGIDLDIRNLPVLEQGLKSRSRISLLTIGSILKVGKLFLHSFARTNPDPEDQTNYEKKILHYINTLIMPQAVSARDGRSRRQ